MLHKVHKEYTSWTLFKCKRERNRLQMKKSAATESVCTKAGKWCVAGHNHLEI